MRALPLLLLLSACSADYELLAADDAAGVGQDVPEDAAPDDLDTTTTSFWLEVEPLAASDAGVLLLPQAFGPFVDGSGFELVMEPAVRISGKVGAVALTPWLSTPLPTQPIEVDATLIFEGSQYAGTYFANTGEDATYELDLVPDSYRVTAIPDDPAAPAQVLQLDVIADEKVDIALDTGVAAWGRVLRADGSPVFRAAVFAATSESATSEPVFTDEEGWYELRVLPGTWEIFTTGDPSRPTPQISSLPVEVPQEGLRVDLEYAEEPLVSIGFRVVDGNAQGLSRVPVTIRSSGLVGYADEEASYTVQTLTDSEGFIFTNVPRGKYDIVVSPATGTDLGAFAFTGQTIQDDTQLPTVSLPVTETFATTIVDDEGAPVQLATLACTEIHGIGRSWSATSNDSGVVAIDLPPTEMACLVTPPTSTLASTQLLLDGSFPGQVDLRPGNPISGRVVINGMGPAERAIVRLRDTDGTVWGTTLTDSGGNYRLAADFVPLDLREP
jgi:hypothetical protein